MQKNAKSLKETINQLPSMFCSLHPKKRDKTGIHFETEFRAFEPGHSFDNFK